MRLCTLLFTGLLAGLPRAAIAIEREPTLPAAELVEPALLAGPHFRVQPYARFVGLQAQFVIETDWGPIDAPSVELLARRVAEMPMVEALHSETIMAALADAGVDSVGRPLSTLATISRDPLGSAARAPGGVVRMLGDRVRSLSDRARRIGKRIDGAVFHEGSPKGGAPRLAQESQAPWWDAPVDEVGRLLRSEAGHDRARREIARAIGIESWSGNPLLRERLDTLAWAVASGRLGSERIIALASAGASEVLSAIATAERITAEPGPEDQRRHAEARLQAWTSDPDLLYGLAWRSAYPPPLLHALLDRVDTLQPAAGVEALLDSARLAETEVEALFVFNALQLLLHNGDVAVAGGELRPAGRLVGYLAPDGEFLLPLAVDRLSWTPEVQRWFNHVQVSEHPRRTVLVAGSISPLAERAITRRGWSLRSHVRWPQSPPYRRPGEAA